MRRLVALIVPMMLSACLPPVHSVGPLFTPGKDTFRPGLWAILTTGDECAAPRDAAVFKWPSCAVPVVIEGRRATWLAFAPSYADFDVVAGEPRIIQFQPANNPPDRLGSPVYAPLAPETRYYLKFVPETGSPFTAGRMAAIACPDRADVRDPAMSGLRGGGMSGDCTATTAQAVRTLATRADQKKANRFVWIAPYP